jgi:chromosome segregation ATPase
LTIVAVVGCLALLQYSKVLAKAKDGYIQELEQYIKLLEDERQEVVDRLVTINEEIDRLEDDNQILGSYIAEMEVQYEQ